MKLLTILAASAISLTTAFIHAQTAASAGVTKVPVTFTGGHDTDPRDRGRPVILIGPALGVTAEIFRDAFSGVRPAGPGRGGPTGEEARANKKVLMNALGKHGITNDRLDEVSNFYRYPPGSRELWQHTEAKANALVKNGAIVGYEIVEGGAGYTTPPTVTVPGVQGPAPKVELAFGKKFETNGSVSAITVVK
ncbi:MAG: hypothetical protein ACO1TE_11000 [Prosthecobacter sp.]